MGLYVHFSKREVAMCIYTQPKIVCFKDFHIYNVYFISYKTLLKPMLEPTITVIVNSC